MKFDEAAYKLILMKRRKKVAEITQPKPTLTHTDRTDHYIVFVTWHVCPLLQYRTFHHHHHHINLILNIFAINWTTTTTTKININQIILYYIWKRENIRNESEVLGPIVELNWTKKKGEDNKEIYIYILE